MSAPVRTDVALVEARLDRGGAERVLVDLANGLDRSRYRVHFVATRTPGPLASSLGADVAVHSLERTRRRDLAALRRFASVIERNRIRLVHTHGHTAAYFVRLARSLSRGDWLHVVHDHHGPVETSPVLRWLDRVFLRRADHYFAVSEPLRRYAVRSVGVPEGRASLLRNGVPLPEPARPAADAPFTVVQVARVEPVKNQLLALEVAARLRTRIPDLRWWFVGRADSAYAKRCRDFAHHSGLDGCVEFLGEREDVTSLLGRAHLGVLTSMVEGLPLALLEYMASALPVVVPDVGQCGALVGRSRGGTAVSPGDAGAFERAIGAFAADPSRARHGGEANRGLVRREYGVDHMVRRVEEVYRALLLGGRLDETRRARSPRGAAGAEAFPVRTGRVV